jgi:small-conductance mechanosensitive channel
MPRIRVSPLKIVFLTGFAAFILLVTPATVFAQGDRSPEAKTAAEEWSRAPVVLDGQPLFTLSGIRSLPAPARAKMVMERIRKAAADPGFSADTLKIEETGDRSRFLYGDKELFALVDLDAESEGITRQLLAEVVRNRILAGVETYRRERGPAILWRRAGYAAGATLLFLAFLFAFRRGTGWIRRRVALGMKRRLEGLEAQSHRLVRAQQLGTFLDGFLASLHWFVVLVLTVAFVQFGLSLFPWTRPVAQGFVVLLIGPLQTMGKGVVVNLPGLVFLAVLTIIVRYILKLVRAFFAGIEAGAIRTARFEREWAWPTYRLLRTAIVVFAVIVGYPYIPGSGSEAFKGISILLGVILSLGSTSFISNIVAGYTMIYRRAFRVGDRICVDQMTGIVTEIGLMVTRLRSPKNEELVLPNSTVLSSLLTNYSKLAREQGLILHTAVGIGYETPWRQVEAMLLEAAARTEGLLREPVPFVLQTQLGDFAITHELNAYCHTPEAMPRLYAAMHRNILDVFNEYGVQIMTPAYEIDPEQPKVVPKEQWFAPPAAARK